MSDAEPTAGRPVDWDASSYDSLADPQEEWAREVLARLELRGDESVLDAGCGSGRVTRLLIDRLPEGKVVAVDASPSMVEMVRGVLRPQDEALLANLTELELTEPVDAIFSNATFHWVLDHDRLFQRLYASLRAGGQLEAQCGGEGNVAEFVRAIEAMSGDERFAPYLRGTLQPWKFAGVGETEVRLERAGFASVRLWLERKRFEPRDPRGYLRASGLASHLDRLPENLHEEFVDAITGSMPRPLVLEYVRLNISARRP
ncbi:MAG TPA: methyltransferase domain-containing protein [Solirubrobacterales bacterium]|nr:methyltransferase domain-containing protein [Solirubrobacterales bacterium]